MRFLGRVIVILIIILLAIGVLAVHLVRSSYPITAGEIRLTGLRAPVEVLRDKHGIPHIYASNDHDLFLAQGFVHAQDRFWQMDFWRHVGSGQLSELFGKSEIDSDRFLRTLGLARLAEKEFASCTKEEQALLQAYANGVNEYLEDRQGSSISLEYAVLALTNRDYHPQPWKPLHSLTWAKVMAWDLGDNMSSEITRSILLKTVSMEQLRELYPPYPSDQPVIVPGFTIAIPPPVQENQTAPTSSNEVESALLAAASNVSALQRVLGTTESIGSNNWVISGKRTATGKPLLANDPHLGVQMPSIWYEVGLHCVPKNKDCSYDVVGFSFAGTPGVVIGHNERIAWGFTNVGPDVQDLYIERINPANPNQYEVNGQWIDMQLVDEKIQVANDSPVSFQVRYTRHGPVVSDTSRRLKDFRQKVGIEVPEQYAIALRWTALHAGGTFQAISLRLNRAQNWEEFREAAKRFEAPGQNMVYADVDGNIGYQMSGKVPIRANGNGWFPVPGWTDDYEWTGFIPFDEIPRAFNPPEGYVASANNAVAGPGYPFFIAYDYDYGFRAERIVEMIESQKVPITITYIQQMQGDNHSANAKLLVPILQQTTFKDNNLIQIRKLFDGWNYQLQMDQPAASLFESFWKHLLKNTFHDSLPEGFRPYGSSRSVEVIRKLVEQPDHWWWDDQRTKQVENRDHIFMTSFRDAVDELEESLGKDSSKWKWSRLHQTVFRNETFGRSGIYPIEKLFNRGPFPTSGGPTQVNATSWDASGNSYEVEDIPSMRMIVDLSNFQNSVSINSTGQSGHAYHPNYIDMANLWRMIEYHPMMWGRAQVQANSKAILKLRP